LTLNKKKSKRGFNNFGYLICLFISPNFLIGFQSYAQDIYNLNEIEINNSVNLEEKENNDFPTNPFEIVDMLRRANSMNDATKPSDAIDEALKSFDMIQEDKQL
tara:strand:+ start:533 stop:844 length:312 start_codon:yes stop_codon:yes gene_type:complete